nr:HD domain-containing protein [Spirochaetaceae bacterium]
DRITREYDDILKIKPNERIMALSGALNRINDVIHSRNVSVKEKIEILLEVSSYSYLINKVTLDEVVLLADGEAQKATFEVARITEKIIKSLTTILDGDINDGSFFYSIMEKSNGVTLRHMVRTFVLSYRFLLFYNKELMYNGLASKIRVKFNKHYRNWYSSLLPHISLKNLTLENIFKGGMRLVPEKDIKVYSLGFLLHDIGKQRYIDYYEGDDDFDRRKVESHAKTGFRMILQKTVYSEDIAAIAGYHHEYYGHESGYGYYRELCALMKLNNKNHRQDSCISYDLDDLHKFNSLSFLPVKFLEIVDVYDAITDPGRSYKSPMNTFEALIFMREEFVINNKKIDLILFELFIKFLNESGSPLDN